MDFVISFTIQIDLTNIFILIFNLELTSLDIDKRHLKLRGFMLLDLQFALNLSFIRLYIHLCKFLFKYEI